MNKLIKLLLEIAGILCTTWGLVTFVKDEKYIYSIILAVVLLVIILFLIRDLISVPIKYNNIQSIYSILDENGNKVVHEKRKEFIVNEKNVTTILDTGYEATGQINFIGTSIGEMLKPSKDGGCLTFITFFKIPLEKNKKYTHIITTEFLNSFTDSKESIGLRIEKKCKQASLVINFPAQRVCKNARTFIFEGEQAKELSKPEFYNEGKRIELVINNPIYKARYSLEIDW